MNEKVENAVRSVLKLDPEFDAMRADAAINVLKGRTVAGMRKVEKIDHVMSRQEVASALGKNVHVVDKLARDGLLRRIPGTGKRAFGISAVSFKEYMEREALKEMGVRK